MSERKLHAGDSLFPDMPEATPEFPTDYNSILNRINNINAVQYAKTRNFINGAVTYLSPYIARGIVSLPFIKEKILQRYSFKQAEKLIQELAWREYFQRIWQYHGDIIFTDLKQTQPDYIHQQIPVAFLNAETGIAGIDKSIATLYSNGYMHNHARMYTAMLACNIAKSHWQLPSRWMYYHLLDGDIASNTLSWQWVASSFSSKKYYANQENINKYTGTNQQHTYLDKEYDELRTMPVPDVLQTTTTLSLESKLPEALPIAIDDALPTFVYNSYNLDPLWHANETGNRILLLEPSHFTKFPVSNKVFQFIIQSAKDNIPGIQIFVGEFAALQQQTKAAIYYKEHPSNQHYQGIEESRDWLFPQVTGNFNSFFAYWKNAKSMCSCLCLCYVNTHHANYFH